MVSIGGNVRPHIGDPVAFQNVSGSVGVNISIADGSGVFVGGLGSNTSGGILRGLSGIAIGLPVSGKTVWVIGYVSG